jgi:O-antigen/teichoic acid export membrane protein
MASQMAIKVISFTFTILIVRTLGADAFGQYAAINAFGALFVVVADLGLGIFAVREVSRHRDSTHGESIVSGLYGNVTVLRLSFAILTQRPWVMVGAIAVNGLGLILYGAQGAAEAVGGGMERLDIAAKARVVYQLGFVILGAITLYLGWGYFGLIVANIVSIALLTYLCMRGVRQLGIRPGKPDPKLWPALLRASLPFALIGFALGLSYKFDTVLLDITRGSREVAYYNAAYNLIFSAVVLSNVINVALYPSLTRQAVTAPDSLPRIYERIIRYLLVVALPIAIGIGLTANKLVPFLFKDSFLPAADALRVLIWVVPLMYMTEFLGYVVLISGREKLVVRAVLISTSVNVLANLVVVPRYGFMGAAVMTVITELILVCQYVWILRDQLSRMDAGLAVLRPLLAAAAMGATIFLLGSQHVFVELIVSGAVYVGLLFALRVLGQDELHLIRSMRTGRAAALSKS